MYFSYSSRNLTPFLFHKCLLDINQERSCLEFPMSNRYPPSAGGPPTYGQPPRGFPAPPTGEMNNMSLGPRGPSYPPGPPAPGTGYAPPSSAASGYPGYSGYSGPPPSSMPPSMPPRWVHNLHISTILLLI